MAREHLRNRSVQPGSDRTFERSERNFLEVARKVLPEDIQVERNPFDLRQVLTGEGGTYGLSPEAKITNIRNNRFFFVEVKKQGPAGNAEERGFRLFTSRFEEFLANHFGLPYHPYVIIFCENLATDSRYTAKFPYFLRKEQYLLWVNYDEEILAAFLMQRCREWLDYR